jgi:hypothetical protein
MAIFYQKFNINEKLFNKSIEYYDNFVRAGCELFIPFKIYEKLI